MVADPATTHGLFEQSTASKPIEDAAVPAWDALTIEEIRLNRPDLIEHIESQQVANLRHELEKATARGKMLQRRERIAQLLQEHGLPLPSQPDDSSSPIVSPVFMESLLQAASEAELRTLITERAELVRSVPKWQQAAFRAARPCSQDQLSIRAANGVGRLTTKDFAKALKVA